MHNWISMEMALHDGGKNLILYLTDHSNFVQNASFSAT